MGFNSVFKGLTNRALMDFFFYLLVAVTYHD